MDLKSGNDDMRIKIAVSVLIVKQRSLCTDTVPEQVVEPTVQPDVVWSSLHDCCVTAVLKDMMSISPDCIRGIPNQETKKNHPS